MSGHGLLWRLRVWAARAAVRIAIPGACRGFLGLLAGFLGLGVLWLFEQFDTAGGGQ